MIVSRAHLQQHQQRICISYCNYVHYFMYVLLKILSTNFNSISMDWSVFSLLGISDIRQVVTPPDMLIPVVILYYVSRKVMRQLYLPCVLYHVQVYTQKLRMMQNLRSSVKYGFAEATFVFVFQNCEMCQINQSYTNFMLN